ncbi:MAG: hypothetical protein IKS31_12410 [Clostridia bacterium]|nr:hypothetical protein [Clostridia bacterium]MBR4459753.1 hypothetical protein [Clostridia bacterium]
MIRKSWIMIFALVMTAVCLFLCWSAVDRSRQQARIAKADENLRYQTRRIPRQEKELAEEEEKIPAVQARIEALRPQVAAAAKEKAEADKALKEYRTRTGKSKSSEVTAAYKERAKAAEARLAEAKKTYERLLKEAAERKQAAGTEEVEEP